MAVLTPPVTRSYPLVAFVDITFEDCVGAAEVALFAIPVGSICIAASYANTVDFAGGTTHDADFGYTSDPDEFSATIVELDTGIGLPTNNLVITTRVVTVAADLNVVFTPTSTGGDPTVGAGYLYFEYINNAKADENYEG